MTTSRISLRTSASRTSAILSMCQFQRRASGSECGHAPRMKAASGVSGVAVVSRERRPLWPRISLPRTAFEGELPDTGEARVDRAAG